MVRYDVHEGWHPGASPILAAVFGLHGDAVRDEAAGHRRVVTWTATIDGTMVGFKLAREDRPHRLMSWLGAVLPEHRGKGVASELMRRQHTWAAEQGYTQIETRSKNQWRDMIRLNLANGFDIVGCYTDEHGEPKIILRKAL